jgi:hypothetical protein
MKKALIVLLILGLAGGLFAQSWSGSVTTGLKITLSDDFPVMATADGDDNGAVKASVSFKNSGDDWGINAGTSLKVGTDGVTGPSVTVGDFNGWVSFGGMFKLTAGKGIGDAWATGGNTDSKIGAKTDAAYRLNITPISGLDFGLRFAYPTTTKVNAGKIGNFFQETGLGAKYDAGVFDLAAGLDLTSEETDPKALDGNAYAGFNYKALAPLVTIHVGTKIANTFGSIGDTAITLFEQLNGSIVGLNWTVKANEAISASPAKTSLEASLAYPIAVNDATSAEVGARAQASYANDFSFDTWRLYAQATYKFNGKVSTTARFQIDDTLATETLVPFLRWTIGYNF